MAQLLLGVDLGTTVLKTAAFDASTGEAVAQASRRLPVTLLDGGGRELDLAEVDRAFADAMSELVDALGASRRDIQGVGLASQGGSNCIADRQTGRARTPMVLWNDGRAPACTAQVAADVPSAFWEELHLRAMPPAGLGRIRLLQDQHAEGFHGDWMHCGAGEYLFFSLTNQWRQDPGHAIQIGAYDAANERLDERPLDLVGMALDRFAPLRKGHETAPLTRDAAKRLNLPEGVPVAGPYIDQEAAFLSASAGEEAMLQCSLGTAWVGNFILPTSRAGASPFQLVLPSPLGRGKLIVQPLLTGNTNWDWALETFVSTQAESALAEAEAFMAERLFPPRGLAAMPWLAQPNPLQPRLNGGMSFAGVGARTQGSDFVRAVAAGMACELRRVFDDLLRAGLVRDIVIGGGASQGRGFQKLLSAAFAPGRVLWQTDHEMAAARGAIYAFSPETARCRTEPVPPPEPGEVKNFAHQYELHCSLYSSVYEHVAAGKAFELS